MESGGGATSLKQQIDTIALHVVRQGASWKQKQGVPLRALIIENTGVVDCVRDLSDTNALSSAIALDNGAWYAKVRRSLTQVVFLFFLSFIQAMYGGEAFDHNPNKRNEHDSAKFALELAWDALTVFCMDADHVALLCLHLNDWHTYLHTHFLKKVFGVLEAAIPEELMLMKRPRYGESPPIAPDGRPWRLNFTTICNDGVKQSGMLLRQRQPCGPLNTPSLIDNYIIMITPATAATAAAAAAAAAAARQTGRETETETDRQTDGRTDVTRAVVRCVCSLSLARSLSLPLARSISPSRSLSLARSLAPSHQTGQTD
jgi:hypothetical protein